MGGIVGLVDQSMSEMDLNRALDSIQHRGPDGRGIFTVADQGIGLGHVRLSVMDPAGPEQPFYAKRGELVLVCNGELYGFENLRDDLIRRGHSFYTHSDAEVILHLYLEYGDEFLNYLRGEFAFLLYDQMAGTLLAVRDHLGVKPLFYSSANQRYLFASEVKAIFATGKLTPKIQVDAVKNLLDGIEQETIFEHVCTVPPGHALSIDLNTRRHSLKQYWGPSMVAGNVLAGTMKEHIHDIGSCFEEAVKLRLRSDVAVGVYLFGDVTGAAMLNVMARHRRAQIKAFNVSYREDPGFDSIDRAKNSAVDVGANFHSLVCDHHALLTNIEDCLWATEKPFDSIHAVGEFLLSKFTSKHVKVVMSNEGASCALLGYIAALDNLLPESMTTLTKHRENRHWFGRWSGRSKKNVLLRELAFDPAYRLNRVGVFDKISDRQQMAHGIEARMPFLDIQLLERILQVPENIRNDVFMKTFGLHSRGFQPGFRVPDFLALGHHLLSDSTLNGLTARYLSREAIEESGLFDYDCVQLLLRSLSSRLPRWANKKNFSRQLVFVLTTQVLDHLFVRNFHGNLMYQNKRYNDSREAGSVSVSGHGVSLA